MTARTCCTSRCTATLPMRFPTFPGYSDETGVGAGAGFTRNFPLPPGTRFDAWQDALRAALKDIADFRADALIVSLGVGHLRGGSDQFLPPAMRGFFHLRPMIGACELPTLFVLEGGYAVGEIGINVVNVLSGFEQASG